MSDLISRNDVIKQIEYHQNHKIINKIKTKYALEMVKSSIEELPTAEPKVGKWIERDDGWGNVFYECSECGEAFTLIDGTPTDNLYYYCPNCGAKMERSE